MQTQRQINQKNPGPDINPKYHKGWTGLVSCNAGEDCVFRSVPDGYQIGKKILETNPLSPQYRTQSCLVGPVIDNAFTRVDAASLYIKNFSCVE